MTGFPEPIVGLVISYSYVWRAEAEQGRTEGRKDRPCAIVLASNTPAAAEGIRNKQVAVVPVTHSPPVDPDIAIEIPLAIKRHLGLDDERSWVILNEINVFTWPGFDLRPIRNKDGRIDYGLLPPKFFDLLIRKYAELDAAGQVAQSPRD